MKTIAFGDVHLDAKIGGYDLLKDAVRALEHVGTACAEHCIELRVMLGDMFHGNRPTPRAWAAFNRALFEYDIPTIVVAGNHDHAAYDPVREMYHAKWTEQVEPEVVWGNELVLGNKENLICCPRWPCIVDVGERAKILVAPYVHNPAAMDEFGRTAQELINVAFDEALKMGDEVKAAFCHLDVDGARAGTEGVYLRGGKLQIPMDLAERCPFPIINGHIHRRQQMGNIYMPGSLVPTDFGDVDGGKGYTLLEDYHAA